MLLEKNNIKAYIRYSRIKPKLPLFCASSFLYTKNPMSIKRHTNLKIGIIESYNLKCDFFINDLFSIAIHRNLSKCVLKTLHRYLGETINSSFV